MNSVTDRVQWEFPAFVSQAREFAGLPSYDRYLCLDSVVVWANTAISVAHLTRRSGSPEKVAFGILSDTISFA
jgi:hypothetical protein